MSTNQIDETDARLRACFEPAQEADSDLEHRWLSVVARMGDAKSLNRSRRRPARVLMAATLIVVLVTGIAAAATGTSPIDWIRPAPAEEPGFPDAATLDAISVFEDKDAARMTDQEYGIIEDMLQPRVGPPQKGRLTRDDLPDQGQEQSRVLYEDDEGRRLSGVRLKNGELCYFAHVSTTSDGGTASCTYGLLKSGVSTGGEWTVKQGLIMYGFLRDDVREVRIRTNTGELQDVMMGRNAFVWNSNSPDRSVRAVAVLVQQPDGAFEEVQLPDEGNVGSPTEGGFLE